MADMMLSGRFARLCRTTKDTLRHYEEMGLLIPASTAENGYKKYLPAQAIDFMFISTLKDAGCSLADIKRLQAGSKEGFRNIMADCREAIGAQIADLERKRELISVSIARIDELESWRNADGSLTSGAWRIRSYGQACYIETQVPAYAGIEKAFDAIASHDAYCEKMGYGLLAKAQQSSYRFDADCFASGEYDAGFFICTQIARPVDCERQHLRPAGRYLQQLNAFPLAAAKGEEGEGNPVFAAYDALRARARREGLAIAGSAYDTELSLGTVDGTDLLWTETSVMVE